MNVSYDYYKIFYYVVKCGSFTGAAEQLKNSQPNITRAMNNLEAQTGLKLFVRSKQGVTLTPEGEQLYEHVRIAFYHLALAEEEMERVSALSGGSVVIGVSEIALHEVLLPKLTVFHKQYPGIKIRLTNQSTPEIIAALKAGLVNFALVTAPFDLRPPLAARKIRDFREVPVAGNEFAELKGRDLSLQELAAYPWISLLPGTATRTHYERFFESRGLKFEPRHSAATTDQILPMIQAGLGIGFVPEGMLFAIEGVFPIRLTEVPGPRGVHLITDTDRPLSAASSRLIEMIEGNLTL